ncbi:MAG: protoporphyrinogen oxidase [Planctomycetaceae bacterium]|nr:protoporphyrinogen oxidase [Planctomycetaceae bacterium]
MSESGETSGRVAVIGGGITGLAAAHRLLELDPAIRVSVFESSSEPGGVLQTVQRDGFCMELGPDSMITQQPWGLDLCRRIGFDDELIGTNVAHRQTFVVKKKRLLQLPEGLAVMAPSRVWPMVATRILSPLGKLRLGWEYFLPKRPDNGDETLAAFARRRFGRETFERLVQPLASGIYMADSERLSMRAGFPRFVEMERGHGSLIRAARDQMKRRASAAQSASTGPRYSLFVAPKRGLRSLIDALITKLPTDCIETDTSVTQIDRPADGGWKVSLSTGEEAKVAVREFDAVIVATPAHAAARLLSTVDIPLATSLQKIDYAGCVTISLAFRREQIRNPLDGFGFVVPEIEGSDVLACTFSSVKYAGRSPEGMVLLRAFLGGACRPGVMDRSEGELRELALAELRPLLGISGAPQLDQVTCWSNVMPQYHVHHLDRVEEIEANAAQIEGLELAGNAFRGVGIPHCIHSGEDAAERVVETVRTRAGR